MYYKLKKGYRRCLVIIGLKRGTVKLLPYDSQWKKEYDNEKELLNFTIGKYILDIQHIGSTSIEGLWAKPIIDIAVGVESLDLVTEIKSLLEDIGYEYRGNAGVEGRVFFTKGKEELRTHYLHIIVFNGYIWRNQINFRDYLRVHKEYIDEYSNLKEKLEAKFSEDRGSYTKKKSEFINMILKKATNVDKLRDSSL
ncbi:GrpB family protein [Dethiothermospora halolimnae]|uniref:GrpB family protein n=1 Tax=Dethiothermospora halolimnae TaxID=3114390 RepID=UPI003CCC4520